MAKRNNIVTIKVHRDFFDKVFEPNRKSFARMSGLTDISQPKFTLALAKAGGINMPRMNMSLFPKKRTRFRL
jgi:hypothetical protein